MSRKVIFTRPTATAAISVTGEACGLNCAHCGARYLKGMRPPDEALAAFSDPSARSVLISGGSDPYGHVPIEGWPEKALKANPGLQINCHTGILDEEGALKLKGVVDVISFDYVSDSRITEGIYGSKSTPADYVRSFILASNAVPTFPHITVGLLGPETEPAFSIGALDEIRALADEGRIPEPPGIVVIVFRPTKGTRLEARTPPKEESVAEVIRHAKLTFPASPISLGCMRPSGAYRTRLDALALMAGADIIVMPTKQAVLLAQSEGLEVFSADECCVFPALGKGCERMDEARRALRFRPSSGTMAALGLKDIKSDALPTTAYIMLGEKCVRDCAFCAQAKSSGAGAGRLSRVTWPEAEEKDLLEALSTATRNGAIKRVCIQTVGGSSSLMAVVDAVGRLRKACAAQTPISVSFSATAGLADVGSIIEAGADKVALSIDACNPELHLKLKKSPMEASLKLISDAAANYPGRISTHLISGMGESERDLLLLAARMKEMGVGLGLFAFTPLRGTEMEGHPKPDIRSYRRVQLAFWLIKHHGLKVAGMRFDEAGRLTGLSLKGRDITSLAADGSPFLTSGCSFCNRPYYNESPGTELYNYPEALTCEQAARALSMALDGLVLD